MKRKFSLYAKDIIENIQKAQKFIEGMSYDDFIKDEKTFYAVVRCIEIIGEAAKNIPKEVCIKYPEIPWREVAGMRDKVIHFYFGIDPEKVWKVLKEDIPLLEPEMHKVFDEFKEEEKD